MFGALGLAVPKLHPDWRMLAGMGGWYVPGPDYLAFLDIFDPENPFLGDTVKAWIDQAQTRWTPTNTRPLVRPRREHLGGRRPLGGVARRHPAFARQEAQGEPIEGSIVSHAFRAADGTAVFIALEWSPRSQRSLNALREGDRRNPQVGQNAALYCARAGSTRCRSPYIKSRTRPRRVFGVGEFMTGSTRSSDGLDPRGGGCCSGPGIAASARRI